MACNKVACCADLNSSQTEFTSGPAACGAVLRYMLTPNPASMQQRCVELGYETYSGKNTPFAAGTWCGAYCNAYTKNWTGNDWQTNGCDTGVSILGCCNAPAIAASYPGDPSLSRAPRVCTTTATDAEIASAHNGWAIRSDAPSGATALHQAFLCDVGGDATIAFRNSYTGTQVGKSDRPRIFLQKNTAIADVDYSYVVESVSQGMETDSGIVGAKIVLTSDALQSTELAVIRAPQAKSYQLRITTKSDEQLIDLGRPELPARFAIQLHRLTDNTATHVKLSVTDRNARKDFRTTIALANATAVVALGVDAYAPNVETLATFGSIVSP
jgi:hypothetical protein